jgi:OOP family OmpA-OmpF porin
MKSISLFLLIPAMLLLSSCAGYNLDNLNNAKARGSDFTIELTKQYRDFADFEATQYDWANADYFAKKGLRTAKGEVVLPENPREWNIPSHAVREIDGYYRRLIPVLNNGARKNQPKLAARAQATFDCWVEQQEENWQSKDIAACRGDFLRAFNSLGGKSEPQARDDQDEPGMIYFAHNSAVVNARGMQTVREAVGLIKSGSTVTIVGYTDKSGGDDYNLNLSKRRAEAVHRALIQAGVDAKAIRTKGEGENDPAIRTEDGAREPRNRRVQIIVE